MTKFSKMGTNIALLIVCLVAIWVANIPCSDAINDRKLLVTKFVYNKAKTFPEIQQIRGAIRNQTLTSLKLLPQSVKTDLLTRANNALTKEKYPVKTATDYMKLFRTGNRVNYQTKLHEERARLGFLVVGQLLEQELDLANAKYMDEIVNGVWNILEESIWCYPAHLALQTGDAVFGNGEHLPLPDHFALDHNTAEVAKILGWVKLMLGNSLNHVSPVVNLRIDYELKRRVFDDYLKRHYGWEGFNGDHGGVNNWNSWINADILKSALFTLDDAALFEKVLNKTLYSVDWYIDNYGDDGGCDEGPGYWRFAGGKFIEYLELLDQIFPGPETRQYLADQKLFHLMGEYVLKAHIGGNYFVNFADSAPRVNHPVSMLAKYGELLGDEQMKQFAGYMLTHVQTNNVSYFSTLLEVDRLEMNNHDLNEFLDFVNWHKQIESYKTDPVEVAQSWFPNIQVVTMRSKVTEANRFFLGAKAGNNHESHNHNDVGSFVLYQNGNPVLIDIGVGIYTEKSFSGQRYDYFYLQSAYHNCPSINGIAQHEGLGSRATNFTELPNGGGMRFQSDISTAYSKEANVKQWTRVWTFDLAKNEIDLEDKYELSQYVYPQQLHFILPDWIEVTKTDQGLHLHSDFLTTKVSVEMQFFTPMLEWKVEVKSLEGDERQVANWGDKVKRLTLSTVTTNTDVTGDWLIKFVAGK